MEEMNRSNDQGLGLLCDYNMMFFVCTVFSFIKKHCICSTCLYWAPVLTGCRQDSFLFKQPLRKQRLFFVRCHPDSNRGNKGFADLRLTTWLWHHKKWSGRRDSDPRHPPWQGGTLPTELLPRKCALGRNRTTDTVIFSHMLYRLSYQGRYWRPGRGSNPRPPA